MKSDTQWTIEAFSTRFLQSLGALLLALSVLAPSAFAQTTTFSPAAPDEDDGSVTVTVTLNGAVTAACTVDYATGALGSSVGDAIPGEDYTHTFGQLAFALGQTSKTFTLTLLDDAVNEHASGGGTPAADHERLNILTSNNTCSATAVALQLLDIEDDEANPELTIADVSQTEGTGTMDFVVSANRLSDEDITVQFDQVAVTAESTADFTAATDATVTLLAGQSSVTISAAQPDDAVYEGDETFNVQLDALARYTVADPFAVGTIVDNEGVPELSIDDKSGAESVGTLDFTVTPSHAAEVGYNATLSYSDVTATAGSDYTPVLSIAIPAAATAGQTLSVAVNDDTEVEGVETFIVSIVDGADYNLDNANGLGAITDNDGIDIALTTSFDAQSYDLDGTPLVTVTAVLTNNGAANPTATVTIAITETGFDMATATQAAYAGTGVCGSANLQAGSCTYLAADLGAGASQTLSFTVNADGAAGTVASMTLTESGNTETDVSNNADSDIATLVGLDFGDGTGTFAAAAHRITADLYLGDTAPDAETSQGAAFAGDGAEDDGLQLIGSIIQAAATDNTINYIGVKSSAAGFLSIVTRYDLTFEAVQNYPVVAGVNWVPVTILPDDAPQNALTAMRLRLCSASGACDEETDLLADGGEIEDYDVSGLVATLGATATFTIPTGTVEPVTVTHDGTNIVIADGNGVTMFSGLAATLAASISITGNANPNTLVVDVNNLSGDIQINYDGGDGADALELTNSGATVFATLTHTFTNATDGSVGDALGTFDVNYLNLAPILDNLSAVARVMTFGAGDDSITLTDNGSSVDGLSFIDSNNSEQVTFANPTTSLTINAGAGDDTIDYDGVDATAPNNTFSIAFNGDTGADTFVILPTATASALGALTVDGGAPAVCPGDVLDIDTSGGAIINNLTPSPVTFTSAHDDITFSNIEAFADQSADVALSATSTAGTALEAGDVTTITLTVTNNGPDTASCVVVADILLGGALTINSGPTFSVGSFNTPQWNVGALASGDTATLTYTVTVGQTFNGTAAITASSPEGDSNATNNSVSFTIDPAFPFPVKAQATAAEWFGSGVDERLVVGLANGFSGLNSSVLCRVPPAAGFPENLWRECGNGLPYPLYVNDLHLDDQGTPGTDDDILYLASWGSAGLYVSTDGGENFTAAEPVLGPKGGWANVYAITEDVSGFLYISTNHGFIYRSLNGGTTWQQIGSLPEVDADTPWSLTTHPTEAGVIYAGTFGRGAYMSSDFGFNWEFVGGDAINSLLVADRGGHVFDLELNAAATHLFAATGGGVFRMAMNADGTAAGLWDMIDTDVVLDAGTVTPEARSLSFDENDDLYVTTWGHGAFFAASPTTTTAMAQIALRGTNVSFMAVSPDGSEVVFGTEADGVVFVPAVASTSTDTEEEGSDTEIPNGYVLNQNYPNPFNPVTTIAFALPETSQARLAVYDVLGREVQVLVQGTVQAGQHEVQFDAAGLPTGTYIYRLETDKGSFTKQLVLMK